MSWKGITQKKTYIYLSSFGGHNLGYTTLTRVIVRVVKY